MIALPRLCVLVDDDERWSLDPVAQARAALGAGVAWLQLRAKHATDAQTLRWAESIAALTREAGALFFVNDRFDLALAAGADGVHLGQGDLPPDRIPERARQRLQIGRSTHTLAQARAARAEPVSYVAFGPVFGTRSKASPYAARGLELVARAAQCADPRPLVAIGGIGIDNAQAVLAAGAQTVCVISAVAGARAPAAAARELCRSVTRFDAERE